MLIWRFSLPSATWASIPLPCNSPALMFTSYNDMSVTCGWDVAILFHVSTLHRAMSSKWHVNLMLIIGFGIFKNPYYNDFLDSLSFESIRIQDFLFSVVAIPYVGFFTRSRGTFWSRNTHKAPLKYKFWIFDLLLIGTSVIQVTSTRLPPRPPPQ